MDSNRSIGKVWRSLSACSKTLLKKDPCSDLVVFVAMPLSYIEQQRFGANIYRQLPAAARAKLRVEALGPCAVLTVP